MPKLFYTFSNQSLSVFVRNTLQTIPATHPGYERLIAHLTDPTIEDHDELLVAELLDKRELVSRLTAGMVTVVGNEVFYRGAPVHSTLTEKLITLIDSGMDPTPWVWFLNNVMENPSDRSRECLYNFIDRFQAPLTPDGCFVAFKYVRDDFMSAHANADGSRMDNSPGKVVEMPRELVDDDPNRTCSSGLHVCASIYLGGYSRNAKVVACKVNPRDVVAVPVDYGYSKMRTCRYEVLAEVTSDHEISTIEKQHVVDTPKTQTSEIPEELRDLPTFSTRSEFFGYWVETDDDPSEGSLVAKGNGCTVGLVTDMTDGEDPSDDGYYDDDGDWIEDGDPTYYTVYEVVWQNGMKESVYVEELDVMPLACLIEKNPVETEAVVEGGLVDHQMDMAQYAAPVEGTDVTMSFTHAATGASFSADELQEQVQRLGQRGFSRLHGVPRSTLQGWLGCL